MGSNPIRHPAIFLSDFIHPYKGFFGSNLLYSCLYIMVYILITNIFSFLVLTLLFAGVFGMLVATIRGKVPVGNFMGGIRGTTVLWGKASGVGDYYFEGFRARLFSFIIFIFCILGVAALAHQNILISGNFIYSNIVSGVVGFIFGIIYFIRSSSQKNAGM